MNRTKTKHKYVELDENHVPIIAGTLTCSIKSFTALPMIKESNQEVR